MEDEIASFIKAMGVAVTLFVLYYYVISLFGLYKKNIPFDPPPQKRFALVTAAHNEEQVIGWHVDCLMKLNYPRELYDVYIVADNCSDRTADVARQKGAIVFERFDPTRKGKGYALEWAFKRLFALEKKYDAVCIFDADNLVSQNFLREMNKELCLGNRCIQGYLDVKNPWDSWITYCYAINFWSMNRLWQLAKHNLGLSNVLGGTGMCIDAELLKEHGWGATCLTEDLEFTMKLLLKGIKTHWSHDAVVFDEKPLTFVASWNQRMRWLQGHWDVAGRYALKLLKKGVMEFNWVYIDAALHLLQPFFVSLGALVLVAGLWEYLLTGWVFGGSGAFQGKQLLLIGQLFYPCLGLYLEGAPARVYLYYVFYPFFGFSWIPITLIAFFRRHRRDWWHTRHVRSVSIEHVASSSRAYNGRGLRGA